MTYGLRAEDIWGSIKQDFQMQIAENYLSNYCRADNMEGSSL